MLVNSDLLSAALTRKIQNGQKLNSILDTCAFNRTNGAKFALATKVLKKFFDSTCATLVHRSLCISCEDIQF